MAPRVVNSPKPTYQQIADLIRAKISSGELTSGSKIPTEIELSQQFGVARGTVRQGLAALVHEGLIEPARPRGYFVRRPELSYYRPQSEWRPQPASPEMDRWMEDQTIQGREPSQSIKLEIIQAPPRIAERLELEGEALVVVRRRVRYIDSEPFNINDSFYPYEIVKESEIMSPIDIARGASQVLTELGHEQVRAIDEIEARMPLPEEVTRLELGPGTPVLVHRLTGFTAKGTPVRCAVTVLVGSKHVMLFERTKNSNGMEKS
jgi:DNA-binding GntR family transcriptional regulator